MLSIIFPFSVSALAAFAKRDVLARADHRRGWRAKDVFGPTVAAVKKVLTDVGREVPDEFRWRTVGARDVSGN